jgi:chitosanase
VPPNTNLAYQKTATSSSNESSSLLPAKAVDGSTSTRWASTEGVDPQWIEIDLGANYAVNKVVLKWEAAYAKAYSIQLSSDGTTWNTVYSTSSGAGSTETLTVNGSGRYIRMYGTKRGTSYGYSLWEFEVYG